MVEWIESFLSNRYQKVVIDGRVSFLALILSGVPQGTVLGLWPTLFLIFINDITACVLTSTWSKCNNMMLHEDKFEYICHQANRSNLFLQFPFTPTYFEYHTLGGITIHPANNILDLGVYTSDNLSWTLHIATISMTLECISQIICPGHSTLLQYP